MKVDPYSLPRLIALCGTEGAGKSTVAECLSQAYGYEIRSFATPIKEFWAGLGVPSDCLYGTPMDKAEFIPGTASTGRDAMVELGGMVCRRLGHDAFVRKLLNDNPDIRLGRGHYVIDDLRFPAEWIAITELGGSVWYVTREEGISPPLPAHKTIVNSGDVTDLFSNIADVLR